QELHVALGREHAEAIADRVLTAEPALVLEPLHELVDRVDSAGERLVVKELEDDVVLAAPLRVELLAERLSHDALPARVELDPAAADLVDHLGRDGGPVAELQVEPALG